MKAHLINIKDLLKRGLLEIFPSYRDELAGSQYSEAVSNRGHRPRITTRALSAAWKAVPCVLLLLLLLGCSTQRHVVTQLVEHTSIDTIYLSNVQYDSIYIYQDHVSEHHLGTLPPTDSQGQYLNAPMRTDTLYIKDVSIEYRYKMLRDTIYKTQVDSIPYQVTITEVKEIQRPLTWYDHLSRAILWLNIGFVVLVIVRLVKKLSINHKL